MPLYEYQCQQCKAHFEKIQKFSDPPLRKCENCGGKLERLLSSPAIQFKGSGWYVTDYARKPAETAKEPATKDSKAPETTKAPSDGKGESSAKTSGSPKSPEPAATKK